MKVLIVDSNAARAAMVEEGLSSACDALIVRTEALTSGTLELDRFGANIIVIACDSPDRDMLENMRQLNTTHPRPVVMFVNKSDSAQAEAAVRAGVSAYVVDGLSAGRVRPVLDVAISRFRALRNLQGELDKAKSDLAARKIIERAKGILMERKKLSEADAYNVLRRSAMTEGKTIAEIAEAIVAVTQLLKA